ncbi:MAG: bifunctional DNA-formamidopyrimidine glycosylase/DNA-(apurinic or apyrimidinic site) lyase [Deltaproteobacteria bacterium]|nr:bifunctional DNA-formamidopyrimidine glycosylase/DNA-(apurinic or apyrimidinic site) lyase [Deltaproteobacteria bacterium]
MPELPEVETVRRTVEPLVVGRRALSVRTSGLPLRLGRPVDVKGLRKALVGQRIVAVARRAKYLLIEAEGGGVVLVHLGMTGRLTVAAPGAPVRPHTHVTIGLDGGFELRYADARRFGFVAPARVDRLDRVPELALLGIEPLGPALTDDALAELARGVRTSSKAFLLDQSRVAGLGNIYVCEALFRAGISPRMAAGRLSRPELARLRAAIVAVLELGLSNRGTTFSDFIDADGREGENAEYLRVYLREGEPCLNGCEATIRRITQNGRSTFFCARCQSRKSMIVAT